MEINRRIVKKPYYGKIIPYSFGSYQMDLMDMVSYRKYNNGIGYALVIIELMSRYLWVYKISSKDETWKALKEWMEDYDGKKRVIMTDDGSEFKSKFNKLLKDEGIRHVVVNSKVGHQVVVERVIRSIKERIRDEWYASGNFNWVDRIDLIVEEYNNNFHSGIKAKPIDVLNGDAVVKVKKYIPREPDIYPGEYVRVMKIKEGMDKPSLVNNWSEKKYKVISSVGNKYLLSNNEVYPRWRIIKALKDDVKVNFEKKRVEVKRVRKEGRIIKKKLGDVSKKGIEGIQRVGKTLKMNPKKLAELVLEKGRRERSRKIPSRFK